MAAPLVSVLIPTAGMRQPLLERAVRSAIGGFDARDVEVIVIPNSKNNMGGSSLTDLANIPCVTVVSIDVASVCAARNLGVSLARGRYVRFLDDDDYLVPDVALRQCLELEASGADISSYAIRVEDERGGHCRTLHQPATNDFVVGQLCSSRLQLVHAHLYRTSLIRRVRWDEKLRVSEDIAWLHRVAVEREIRWIKSDDVVGIWYQHAAPRLSYAHGCQEPHRNTSQSILETASALLCNGRMNDVRKRAAASGLWACVHRVFYLDPIFWHGVAKRALSLDPSSHPDLPIFSRSWVGRLNPVWVEWLMVPKRFMNHCVRGVRGRLFGWDYVRTL